MRTPNFDFVGRRRLWIVISGGLALASILALLIGGVNLSIDFEGGSSFLAENITEEVTPQQLREAVEGAGATDVTAQLSGSDDSPSALVRTASLEPGSATANAVRQAILEATGAEDVQISFVGPTWGQRISRQALEALLVFLVVVVIYISLRLEFKMAVTAVVALVHDILITIGVYAAFRFTVSPSTVIALLTILGYSLYDTVVVFDRVKENGAMLGTMGRRTYDELVNTSMNEVVVRSLNTSLTSLLPVGSLLFLGAQLLGAGTLEDLALALFVGMALGVYSSLFVAGPLFAWWKMQEPAEVKRAQKVAARVAAGEEPEVGSVSIRPESQAPITTEYVRGPGSRPRRERRG